MGKFRFSFTLFYGTLHLYTFNRRPDTARRLDCNDQLRWHQAYA